MADLGVAFAELTAFFHANARLKAGTGSPEGVVASSVGTIYVRTDGGVGTTLYTKESGTGNTGWIALTTAANKPTVGVASGYKIARGQLTTATASDTVVTGLATVVSVVASLETDPADNTSWVSAQVGNQAGAPAAGSIIIKTWQNTTGTDPTPVAAAVFSKLVNWIAVGT